MVVVFVQLFVLFVQFVFVDHGRLLPSLLEISLTAGFGAYRDGRNELLQIFIPARRALRRGG